MARGQISTFTTAKKDVAQKIAYLIKAKKNVEGRIANLTTVKKSTEEKVVDLEKTISNAIPTRCRGGEREMMERLKGKKLFLMAYRLAKSVLIMPKIS